MASNSADDARAGNSYDEKAASHSVPEDNRCGCFHYHFSVRWNGGGGAYWLQLSQTGVAPVAITTGVFGFATLLDDSSGFGAMKFAGHILCDWTRCRRLNGTLGQRE